jgi:predicted nucleic acid-binding protein
MIYADTDFFLALLKPSDWLKDKAKKILEDYNGKITTSTTTFIELALLAKRYSLDVVRIFNSVMAICGVEDEVYLKAAIYMRDYNLSVFDAFHAAYCRDKIISSDSIYEKIGIERVKLEEK